MHRTPLGRSPIDKPALDVHHRPGGGPGEDRRGYGRIINISSVHGVQHIPSMTLYGITKGGINEFTRGLEVELGPHGITAT